MKLVFNAIIAIFLIIHGQFSSALEIGIANATNSALACNHNGTRFANGSFVPTIEPCLNCKCVNANLICALRVCPEQPFPPPRGCVTVQKRDSCCPYITCSKHHTTNTKTQEKNVITHDRKWYEQNIKNRIFSQNAIQRRIDDTDFDGERIGNEKMCVYNGTVYRSGSAMSTSSLCQYCYCIGGRQKCVEPKCTLPEKGCEPIFIDSSCCPIRYDCSPNKNVKTRNNAKNSRRRNGNKHYLRMTSRMQRSRGCLIQSTFYPEGHKLPANETNPCEICFCIGGTKQCTPKKCAPTIKNCTPIIPDGQCCPSSYECNHRSNHASARQYDLYSLFFGDENKENSTASWDYESDTEPTNVDLEVNATSEKGFFDALRETLTQDLKKTAQNLNSTKGSNGSGVSPSNTSASSDEEDDEEISLLDFFLNGDTTPTTPKVVTFNVTGRPLANGMTNSPMQIKPVFAGSAVNESFKFAMLPASLYNMVNDDGKIIFDASKATENPITISHATAANNMLSNPSSPINLQPKYESTTKSSPLTTKIPSKKPTIVAAVKPVKTHEALVIPTSKIESSTIFNNQHLPSTTLRPLTTSTHYPESSTVKVEQMKTTTLSNNKLTIPPSKAVVTNIHSTQKTTQKPRIRSTTSSNLIASNHESTQKPIIRQTTTAAQVLTTTIKSIVRTTPVPKLNPSILESDLSYDYSEPTLPPSLPNLKIIPFLPTDAVKNSISKSSYKPNINYYQHQPDQQQYHGSYSDANSQNTGGNYSPFSSKPKPQNLFVNKADDRVDYATYRPSASNQDSEDYISIYSGTNNVLQPQSIQMTVNSHLGYGSVDNKYTPPKVSSIPNKNLTVKPPLPPFEPEYEYELYNLPPSVQLKPTNNNYNQFSSSAQGANSAFSSEHNYNVPHFVTMPALEIKNDDHRDSVFSYSAKNSFIPPAKTEGGFVPKRVPTIENYIPLHGESYYAEHPEPKDSIIPEGPIELKSKNESHQEIDEKNIISITTDANYKLHDTSIRTNAVDPIEFATFSVSTNPPTTATELITSTISTSESTKKNLHKNASNQMNSNSIPLKLITILHNTKKENPTKVEIPQRKNNKIIDPTDEPLIDATSIPLITTEMPNQTKNQIDENSSPLRDIFLSAINRQTNGNSDVSEDLPPNSSIFLQRPINQFSPSFISSASFPSLTSSNTIESKHSFQSNPVRSELDLIITELNKNKQSNEFSHTNNFSSENYQVLPADDTNISNTESYVVNPVDVDKLKQHHSNGETKIFTPPLRDPAGLFKLDGCNIYGRMYRVNRVIAELSSPCLECRCTEVGVSCTPLTC